MLEVDEVEREGFLKTGNHLCSTLRQLNTSSNIDESHQVAAVGVVPAKESSVSPIVFSEQRNSITVLGLPHAREPHCSQTVSTPPLSPISARTSRLIV